MLMACHTPEAVTYASFYIHRFRFVRPHTLGADVMEKIK